MKSVIFHIVAFFFLFSIFWVPVMIFEGYWFFALPLYMANLLAWSIMLDNDWHM